MFTVQASPTEVRLESNFHKMLSISHFRQLVVGVG